jgi:hypothetical protein
MTNQGGTTAEERAKIFHRKMLRGNAKGTVRLSTKREEGGILLLDVPDVLTSKDPRFPPKA